MQSGVYDLLMAAVETFTENVQWSILQEVKKISQQLAASLKNLMNGWRAGVLYYLVWSLLPTL